jgi:hypothetical protein
MENNYKAKYEQLKMQYMQAVDVAYRQGYEDGGKSAQMDQMAQQQQQQAELESAQAGGQPGQPSEEAAPGEQPQEEQNPASEHPDGSELDQHIAKLESLLGKAEVQPEDLKKASDLIKEFKLSREMKKSEQAIKGIAKALHKPAFKMSVQASSNLNDNAKKSLGMQEKIVTDIMKAWSEEESRASKSIHSILGVEGLTKGE